MTPRRRACARCPTPRRCRHFERPKASGWPHAIRPPQALEKCPQKRPSVKQLLAHSWFDKPKEAPAGGKRRSRSSSSAGSGAAGGGGSGSSVVLQG